MYLEIFEGNNLIPFLLEAMYDPTAEIFGNYSVTRLFFIKIKVTINNFILQCTIHSEKDVKALDLHYAP